jgi:Aldehyde dehydrogenase family
MAEYTVTNPATNTVVCSVATATDAAVSRADAPTAPGDESPSPSAPHLAAVAREYRADRERLAAIITREMGKPSGQALGEVDLVAWCSNLAAPTRSSSCPTPTSMPPPRPRYSAVCRIRARHAPPRNGSSCSTRCMTSSSRRSPAPWPTSPSATRARMSRVGSRVSHKLADPPLNHPGMSGDSTSWEG